MAYGSLAGSVKDWADSDIEGAKQAGYFFEPYQALRDYGTQKGYTVDWDSGTGNVKINNNPYTQDQLTASGLYNNNGRWMGSASSLDKMFNSVQNVPAKQWNLSKWSNTGNEWTNQPVLNVDGQEYRYKTPTEYINKLTEIKNTGYGGNIDQMISELQTANNDWAFRDDWWRQRAKEGGDLSGMPNWLRQEIQQPQQQIQQQPQQQPQQNNNIALRDFAISLGQNVGWDAATGNVTVGNRMLTPQQLQQLGLQNIGGRWTGNENQIANIFGLQQLRGTLEGMGISPDAIQYNNGQLTINGISVPINGLQNVGGRLYGTPQAIDSIVNRIGGAVPIGQEFKQINGQQGQQINPFQDSINQLQESNQNLLNQLQSQKINFESQLASYIEQSGNKIQAMVDGLKNYQDEYKGYFTQILSEVMKPFNYDPNTDAELQDAYRFADAKIQADLIRRGMDDSSLSTSSRILLMKELMPRYQNLALERYNSNISKMIQMGNFVQGLSREAFDRYSAYTTAAINSTDKLTERTIKSFEKVIDDITEQQKNVIAQEKNQVDAMDKSYQRALDILDKVGYVTNDIAAIIGLPVGTPSRTAKEFMIKRIDEYNKLNINYQNEINAIDYKSQIEKNKLKEEAALKNKSNAMITSINNLTAKEGFKLIADNIDMLIDAGIDLEPINKFLIEKAKQEETSARDNFIAETGRLTAETGRINAETNRMNAGTSARNADIAAGNLSLRQQEFNNKQDEKMYDEIVYHIENSYKTGRDNNNEKAYTGQDIKDIDTYTRQLDNQGVPSEIIDSVRALYKLDMLPE